MTSRLSIKNVKHAQFASQETNCFECTVYFDGVRVGSAANSGHGGCTDVEFNLRTMRQKIQEYIDTLPDIVAEMSGTHNEPFRYRESIDNVIDGLLVAWLQERDVKRLLAKRVLWTKTDTGGIWQTRALSAKARDHLLKAIAGGEYPPSWGAVGVVLNSLPLCEAVALSIKDQQL